LQGNIKFTFSAFLLVRSVPYFHTTFRPEITASVASRGLASEESRDKPLSII